MNLLKSALLATLVGSASLPASTLNAQPATPSNRIDVNGQPLWISGTNVAWVDFASDLGPGGVRFSEFDRMFRELRANGGNTVRFWMHTTGARTPEWSGQMVTGPGSSTIQNLTRLLDMAESYDITMLLSLWSFDMLRIANGTTNTDRAYAILTQDANRQSYIQNALIPMVNAVKGHKAILAWEIFNEAEGMSNEFGWDFNRHVPMADIQKFVNQTAGAIKRTDPTAKVTTGIVSPTAMSDIYTAANPIQRNYYRDDRLFQAGGDASGTLDFYTFHYYGYGDSPFNRHASYFQLDKPVFIGEFFIKGTTDGIPAELQYKRLYDNGYAGALSWQWVDWAQNRDNNTATWPNTLLNTQYMYSRHNADVNLALTEKPISYSFEVSQTTIEEGFSSILSWKSRNAVSAKLNGTDVFLMDRLTVTPTTSTTYRLVLEDKNGVIVRDSVTVTVTPQLEVNRLQAGPRITAPDNTWTYGDMDASYGVVRVDLNMATLPASGFDVQTSFDGHTWTTVRTEAGNTTTSISRSFTFTTPVHARFLRVRSDHAIQVSDFKAFGLLSELQPPKLDVISPTTVQILEQDTVIPIVVNAVVGTSGFGINGVRFYANDVLIGSDRFAPYSLNWTPTVPGTYKLHAMVSPTNFPNFQSRPVNVTILASQEKRRYEAEAAQKTGTVANGADGAASGGAYLNMSGDGSIIWSNVTVVEPKPYTIRIGYNLPFSEKTQYLRVNGVVTDTIVFAGPTTTWQWLERTVDLRAGSNTIEILHFWGYMWFDYIEIRGNGQTTDIEQDAEIASDFKLEQNYPNPFNPSTVVGFSISGTHAGTPVQLRVFDILGREVAVLVDGWMPAGFHQVTFDASGLASGIYMYRLQSGGQSITRRMILIK
jgi:hypothetical protein